MSAFDLRTRHEATTSVITVSGDLDMASAPILAAVAGDELASPECAMLTLDLSDLEFLDSSGLGCWVDLHNRAARLGKGLRFQNLPNKIRRIIEIGGLAEHFGIAPYSSSEPSKPTDGALRDKPSAQG